MAENEQGVQPWTLIADPYVSQLVFAYEAVLSEMRKSAPNDTRIGGWVKRLDFARDEFVQQAATREQEESPAVSEWTDELVALRPRAHQHLTLAESYATLVRIFDQVGEAHIAISRSGRSPRGMSIDERVKSLLEQPAISSDSGANRAAHNSADTHAEVRDAARQEGSTAPEGRPGDVHGHGAGGVRGRDGLQRDVPGGCEPGSPGGGLPAAGHVQHEAGGEDHRVADTAATRVTESGADPSGASSPAGVERNHGMASGSSHPTAVSSEALRALRESALDLREALVTIRDRVPMDGYFLRLSRAAMEKHSEALALASQQSPSAPSREPCKCGFTRNGRVLPSCPFCTEQPSESPAEGLRERIARILVGVANDPKYEGHGPREAALYAADLILTAIAQERA